MRNFSALVFGTFLVAGTTSAVQAQSLVSGFMAGKGHGSVVLSGTTERYDNGYLAPENIDRVPVFQEVRVNSLNLYTLSSLSLPISPHPSLLPSSFSSIFLLPSHISATVQYNTVRAASLPPITAYRPMDRLSQ